MLTFVSETRGARHHCTAVFVGSVAANRDWQSAVEQ